MRLAEDSSRTVAMGSAFLALAICAAVATRDLALSSNVAMRPPQRSVILVKLPGMLLEPVNISATVRGVTAILSLLGNDIDQDGSCNRSARICFVLQTPSTTDLRARLK